MRHRALLLISACLLAAQASADEAPLRGSAEFAGGRGHVTLGGGVVDFGVEQAGTGLSVFVDGEAVSFRTDDRVDGSVLGGRVSYVLNGERERTWFGRNTRLSLDIVHGWADREEIDLTEDALTVNTALLLHASSADGRAMAYSLNTTTAAAAYTSAFGAESTSTDLCTDTNGSVAANAVAAGGAFATATCTAGATEAESLSQSGDGPSIFAAETHALILTGTPFAVETLAYARYDIEDTRVEAAMAGDYALSPALTLAPSLALVGGKRKLKFLAESGIIAHDGATDFVIFGATAGTLLSKDVGVQAGSDLTYEFQPGLRLFASAKAALLHRKVTMDSAGGVGGGTGGNDFRAYTITAGHMESDGESAAFRGQFETGGSYEFDAGFLGPLRLALTGGLTYDSAVANYEAVKASPALDPPFAPADIGFAAETDYYAKAELTLELP